MKLGAITNGISQDFETALKTMSADGIEYAELQFIWDTEICHHTGEQNAEMKALLEKYGIRVACIMKHVLNGLDVMTTEIESDAYQQQLSLLKNQLSLPGILEPISHGSSRFLRRMSCLETAARKNISPATTSPGAGS